MKNIKKIITLSAFLLGLCTLQVVQAQDSDGDGISDEVEGCSDQNLVVNGDFEIDDFSDVLTFPNGFTGVNGTFIGSNYNTNTLSGWQYTSNMDGWVNGGTKANSFSGNQYIDVIGNMIVPLDTTAVNELFQVINTIQGSDYTLEFYWGEDIGHNAGEPVTLDFEVLDGNNQIIVMDTLKLIAVGPIMGLAGPNTWFLHTVTFKSPTDQITIKFRATPPAKTAFGGSDYSAGAALDLVRVTRCDDTDGDGIVNSLDLDSDNDGESDSDENDPDGDGFGPDDCDNDGIPNFLDVDPCVFKIPHGFSPNGDGVNDTWIIAGLYLFQKNKMTIINRWGDKVFEEEPYKNNWNGTNNFGIGVGGDQLPVGTYFYILEMEGRDPEKGTIYINK